MKWITRSHVHVDRVACPWLITRFVDSEAEFIFAPRSRVMEMAENTGAIPFDTEGAKLHHRVESAAGYGLRFPDDLENIERQFEVYDALYAWCRLEVAKGTA